MSRVARFQLAKRLDQELVSPTKNLFLAETPNNPGPQYDDKGTLVPTSIVGKPEWFFRVQDNRRAQSNKVDSFRGSVIREDDSNRSGNQKPFSSSRAHGTLQQTIQQGSVFYPLDRKNAPYFKSQKPLDQSDKNRVDTSFTIVPKENVLEQIKTVKFRCEQNQLRSKRLIEGLKINAKQFMLKESRVLDTFDKHVQQFVQSQKDEWEERSLSLSSKVGRKPNQTLLNKSSQYRKRVEEIETLAMVSTDIERLTHRYWYLNLRQYPSTSAHHKSKPIRFHSRPPNSPPRIPQRHIIDHEHEKQEDSFHLSDIYNGFNTRVAFNPNKQVEVVMNGESTSQDRSSLYSRQFLSSFEGRKLGFKDQIGLRKAECVDESFIIEGQNVLEREIRFLMSDPKKPFVKFEMQKEENEEVINKEHWDRKELGRTGHQFYPQLLQHFE